jgi:predicted homoserine dehydrogenase-like protein
MGFAHTAKIIRPVAQGKMVTYADVEMPDGGFAQHLRKVQDASAIQYR